MSAPKKPLRRHRSRPPRRASPDARPRDYEELLAVVRSKFYEDEDADPLHEWLARGRPNKNPKAAIGRQYNRAKQLARDGDLEPLRQFLTDLTGDPEITQFIARPRPPKHKRRDLADSAPFVEEAKRIQGDMVRRIRQILEEVLGKRPANAELLHKIAGRLLIQDRPAAIESDAVTSEDAADEICKIIKRGY
jgi:hypothetical protein